MTVALAWLLKNWRLASAVTGSAFVVGFVLLALHWKADAEAQREAAEIAKRQAAAEHRATQSSDRHSQVESKTAVQVQTESDKLKSLPGASNAIDPARRAALCDSLKRLRNVNAACTSHP